MTNRSADNAKKPEGVDLPQTVASSSGKSSDEILAELFGTLNAKPPESVEISTDNKSKTSEKYKHHRKNKKHKRKHKSKSKKSKKHKQMSSSRSKTSRASSSSDTCDIGDASLNGEDARPSSVEKSVPLCVENEVSKCPKHIDKDTFQNLSENAEAIQQEMQFAGPKSDCSQSKKDPCSNDNIENVQPASNISNIETSNTLFCKEVSSDTTILSCTQCVDVSLPCLSNNTETTLGITNDAEERNKIDLSVSAEDAMPTKVEQSLLILSKGDEGTKEPPDSSTAVANKMTKGPNLEIESRKQSSSPSKKLGKKKEASPVQSRSHQNSKRRRSQDARHRDRSKSLERNQQPTKNDRKSKDKDDHHSSKKKRSRSHDRRRRSRSRSKTVRSTECKKNTSGSGDSKRHTSGTKRKSRSHERGSHHNIKHSKKREESSNSKSKQKKTRSRSRSKGPSKRSLSRDKSVDTKSTKKSQGKSSSKSEKISQDSMSEVPKQSVSMDRKTSENPKSVEKNINSLSCETSISDSNVESLAKTDDENHCSRNEEEQSKCVDNHPNMETGNQTEDKDLSSPKRDKKSDSPVVDESEVCNKIDCKENPQKLSLNEGGVMDETKKNDECNECDENQLETHKKESHTHESSTSRPKSIAKDSHRPDRKRRSKSTDSHSRRSRRKSKSKSRDKESKRTGKPKESKSKDRHIHRNDKRSRSRSKHRHDRRSKSLSKHKSDKKSRSRSRSKQRSDKKSRSRSKHRTDKKSKTRSRSNHRSDKKSRSRSRSKHRTDKRSRSHSKHRSDKRSRSRSRSKHRTDKRSRSHSKHRNDKRSRSRSRSKHRTDKRSRSHSRHRSDKRSRSRSKHRTNRRSRSKSHKKRKSTSKEHEDNKKQKTRSKSKDAERTIKKSRSKSRDKDKSSSRNERKSRSRSHDRSHRSSRKKRSRSREVHIDKRKLFEIARKNAMSMLKQSVVPFGTENIVAIKAGGKSVEELTDFCKQLSKKEGGVSSDENNEDEDRHTDDEVEKAFHHPFQLKERPTNIVLNIRNSVPVPTKTFQEKTMEQSKQLRLQFPVSSGQNHRKTESEWVPVEPSPSSANGQSSTVQASSVASQLNQSLNQTLTQAASPTVDPASPSTGCPAVEAADVPSSSSVFPPTPASPPDIGNIVEKRVNAMRKLSANPNDSHAISQIYQVNQQMSMWLASKQQPGQFTGSTGAKVLSAAELSTGYQAWAKKASPVSPVPIVVSGRERCQREA